MHKLLVIHAASLGWDLLDQTGHQDHALGFHAAESIFPAVTCTAQASFRTASPPARHGMTANGLYFRNLRKPMFWEQAASLVDGPRIWEHARAAGRTVGMMFWQQSLGEQVDLVLSPRPIHKHSGGMIQDCYTRPPELYAELTRHLGRAFNLMHYWGPLAGTKSSAWIVDATRAVMQRKDGPDILFTYLPHLDYDLQRHGPGSPQATTAVGALVAYLAELTAAAAEAGYGWLVTGDYAMGAVKGGAVFPNRALRQAGLFRLRHVRGMAYPDFFSTPAVAVADHEVAQVYVQDPARRDDVRGCLESLPGVEQVLDRQGQADLGCDHPNGGELLAVAEEGYWFAYPWWTDAAEAPDYARHIDIHNKPGFDPCELFFGWPPLSVSMNTAKVKGTHGRAGPGRRVAWAASVEPASTPETFLDLAAVVKQHLGG
jgi:predicted AlkP superfamily pyrophosphatase or phosphodiesterase